MKTLRLIWRFRFALYEILTIFVAYIEARADHAITDEEWKDITDRLRRLLDTTNI